MHSYGVPSKKIDYRHQLAELETQRPRATTAPLLAVACSKWRSRPGSEPEYRTIAGIVIEGIEDLAEIADGVA
jgi:hypothetical protein